MILGYYQYQKYKKLKVINLEKSLGVSVARNLGMKEAKGEYVAFLDSDDFSSSERIAKQVQFLENNPSIDILGGRSIYKVEGQPGVHD